MWIGAIRLAVETKDSSYAGTDSLVTTAVLRDGDEIVRLRVDYAEENDLERGAVRNYDYLGLPRRNDQTPELPDGIGQNPMPYPDYGLEFSSGLENHLVLRLEIHNDDMWIKDNVRLYVKQIRQKATSFDTVGWKEDSNWDYVGSWNRDVAMSTDWEEGARAWRLRL